MLVSVTREPGLSDDSTAGSRALFVIVNQSVTLSVRLVYLSVPPNTAGFAQTGYFCMLFPSLMAVGVAPHAGARIETAEH